MNHLLHRLLRIIGLLLACLGLCACSTVKLGYNNLDSIAYWWLDSTIDFSDEQTSRVREDLASLHQWHRTTELPKLAALLGRMEQMVAADFSAAQACAFVAPVRDRARAVADQAEPAAARLALDLGSDQLQHLERHYLKNNADFRKDWVELPAAQLRDKRLKQLVERGEMVYGTLEEPQRALLRQLLESSGFDPRRVLAERQRRQRDALQTLGRLAGRQVPQAEAQALLRGYIDRLENSPDAAWRQYQEAQLQFGCRTVAALHASTSAAQREAAVRRLRAWQRDLRELSARP